MTMREFTHKHLSDMVVVFMGDVGNNVARSLALGAVKLGMDMRLCGPNEVWPERPFLDQLEQAARAAHGKISIGTETHNDVDTSGAKRRHKRWPEALKREIVAATLVPGASVSVVARQYDVRSRRGVARRAGRRTAGPSRYRKYGVAVTPRQGQPD